MASFGAGCPEPYQYKDLNLIQDHGTCEREEKKSDSKLNTENKFSKIIVRIRKVIIVVERMCYILSRVVSLIEISFVYVYGSHGMEYNKSGKSITDFPH